MTIAIAVAVPDGIALASDTLTSWTQTINKAKEKGTGKEFELDEPIVKPMGGSKMARKLFPLTLADTKYAVCTAGASSLNRKSMYAIFKSLEHSYTGNADLKEIGKYLVKGLEEELKQHHGVDDLSTATTLLCNFILAGFDDGNLSKPHLESHVVFSGKIEVKGAEDTSGHIITYSTDPKNRYNCVWIGKTEFINHIVNHRNTELPKISGQYHLMTLEDAKDYTRFLVEFICDFQRFAVMVPDCGRPIVSATLTSEEYTSEVLR